MYCIYCGKPIPDGGKCNCKDPVTVYKSDIPYSTAPVISPYTPPEATYTSPELTEKNPFWNILRPIAGSVPVLIFAILSCLGFVLDLISFNVNIPILLTAIGAFLVYTNSRQKNSIIKKSGYTLFSIVTIVNLATHCVISISLIIYLIRTIATGMMDERVTYIVRMINDDFEHSTIRLTVLANVSICLIVAAVVILVFLYLLTLNFNLLYIRRRISSQAIKGSFHNFANVMMIIHGVLGFVTAGIIFKEPSFISNLLYDILSSDLMTVYKMLTVSLKFGLPATLMVISIARILGGVSLCRLNSRIRCMK